jgi:hypothetical protein
VPAHDRRDQLVLDLLTVHHMRHITFNHNREL